MVILVLTILVERVRNTVRAHPQVAGLGSRTGSRPLKDCV
jgi:hypothetical protein